MSIKCSLTLLLYVICIYVPHKNFNCKLYVDHMQSATLIYIEDPECMPLLDILPGDEILSSQNKLIGDLLFYWALWRYAIAWYFTRWWYTTVTEQASKVYISFTFHPLVNSGIENKCMKCKLTNCSRYQSLPIALQGFMSWHLYFFMYKTGNLALWINWSSSTMVQRKQITK